MHSCESSLLRFTLNTFIEQMITIKVNNIQKELPSPITLTALVEQLAVSTNGIAIAINNEVVKKEQWETQQVVNNDAILIIKSTQGG